MFKNILVPTDLRGKKSHALGIAVKMTLMDQGRIVLLHVIETIADASFEEFKNFYTKLEKKARKQMDALIEQYDKAGAAIDPRISYGNRAREILKVASNDKVDLIVLDSHRINPKDPVEGWGTISYKIGVLAHCPVLLVK